MGRDDLGAEAVLLLGQHHADDRRASEVPLQALGPPARQLAERALRRRNALGLVHGAINGFLATKGRLPAFVVTLT